MVTVQREIERKFAASEDLVLPDLPPSRWWSVAVPGGEVRLEAVYYDTSSLALAREGMTLRRRQGGADAGWHLKAPAIAGAGREEIGVPLAEGEEGHIPSALADLVTAIARRDPLVPVARVVTRRQTTELRAADGMRLADVTDDRVESTDLRTDGRRAFRELEVELAERLAQTSRGEELVAEVGRRLKAAGAQDCAQSPKVVRALGPDASAPPTVPRPPDEVRPSAPAGDLAIADISAHVRAMIRNELPVRLELPDAVHKCRVAVRRLRSSLRTFGPLLDPERVESLEPELVWLGELLGAPRDAEVIRERVLALIDELPPGDLSGPVRDRLATVLAQRYEAARARMLEGMSTDRYLDALDSVVDLATRTPLRGRAGDPVADVVPHLVRAAWKRLSRRVAAAEGAPAHERDELLHAARKAAKQARYAAEACSRTYGWHAEDLARQAESVQEVLGEHQDSVVTARLLEELAGQAQERGEDTATYDILISYERGRARRAEEVFDDAWREASRREHRTWLRHKDG